MIRDTARKLLRRFKTYNLIIFLLFFTTLVLVGIFAELWVLVPTIVAVYFGAKGILPALSRKMLYGALMDSVDAPLFYELTRQYPLVDRSGFVLLDAEYAVGLYGNVIALCERNLNDGKLSAKYGYGYYSYLANVYFDIDDTDALRSVCDRFDEWVASAKPSKREKISKYIHSMSFYRCYLERDYAGCRQFLSAPQSIKLYQMITSYRKGRLSLLEGNPDIAVSHFEAASSLSETCHLYTLSQNGLRAIHDGIPYRDTLEPVVRNDNYVAPRPSRVPLFFSRVNSLICILLFIGWLCLVCYLLFTNFEADDGLLSESEYRHVAQEVLERDYDHATILDSFELTRNGNFVDYIFLSQCDDKLLIGTLHRYENDDDFRYSVLFEMPTIDKDDFRISVIFLNSTSDYWIHSCFCSSDAYVNDTYCHRSAIKLNKRTVYFVVDQINIV